MIRTVSSGLLIFRRCSVTFSKRVVLLDTWIRERSRRKTQSDVMMKISANESSLCGSLNEVERKLKFRRMSNIFPCLLFIKRVDSAFAASLASFKCVCTADEELFNFFLPSSALFDVQLTREASGAMNRRLWWRFHVQCSRLSTGGSHLVTLPSCECLKAGHDR